MCDSHQPLNGADSEPIYVPDDHALLNQLERELGIEETPRQEEAD